MFTKIVGEFIICIIFHCRQNLEDSNLVSSGGATMVFFQWKATIDGMEFEVYFAAMMNDHISTYVNIKWDGISGSKQ